MLKENKFNIALLFGIGIILGIILTIVVKKYSVFSINNSVSLGINPIEVLSVSINAILAIYITRILSKQNDTEKSKKELMINYLKDYRTELSAKLTKHIESNEFATPQVGATFKILRSKLTAISNMVVEYQLLAATESALLTTCNNTVTELWELFTDTLKTANTKSPKAVKEDIDVLRLSQLLNIEKKIMEFDKLIFELTIKVSQK